MNNCKGFTLTEILLAVLIVGLIGIALAALTGTAVRESGVGRTRLMLRNQVSAALRQLRQDVHLASAVTGCNGGSNWTLQQKIPMGPNYPATDEIKYELKGAVASGYRITRNGKPWLNYVKVVNQSGFKSPSCTLKGKSAMQITLVVGVDSEPPVTETVQETFVLPHGF